MLHYTGPHLTSDMNPRTVLCVFSCAFTNGAHKFSWAAVGSAHRDALPGTGTCVRQSRGGLHAGPAAAYSARKCVRPESQKTVSSALHSGRAGGEGRGVRIPKSATAGGGPDGANHSKRTGVQRSPNPLSNHSPAVHPPTLTGPTRERTSEAAPEAVRWAVGGGCQSGWGRLL